jgi:acyl-CoA reductase-like NAD-dependent aldehyde dehydrogenase
MASVEDRPRANGAASAEAPQIEVENPATGEVIATVPDLSAADVAELAAAGRAAQPGWEALGFEGRARVMLRAQKWLTDNSDRVIATIVSETGKAWEDAQVAEVLYAAGAFGFWAKNAEEYLRDERVKSSSVLVKGKKLVLRYKPLGLVGVIGPWNYPLTNSIGDCIPALMAGNAVILKPSEITPLTSLLIAEGLRECGVPEGVFQVATGRGDTGAALIGQVDMVMFTGSTRTGRKVAVEAAQTLTPVSLELGGNDPMIVLSDADLERAANHAVYYSMFNGGQTCISITFPPQLETVERQVQDALQRGAKAVVGGRRRDRAGYWFEPTVLVDVDQDMEIMREETFGPTLPIMKVADVEEAVRLANDSEYGLSASVFSKDVARGEAVARRIEAGAVCVNDALLNYAAFELPMGGWKASGLGSRHGAGGIRKYCKQQAILVSRFHLAKEPHMYPYRAGMTRRLARLIRLLYGRGRRD